MLCLSAMPPVEVPVPIRPLPLDTHLFVVGAPIPIVAPLGEEARLAA